MSQIRAFVFQLAQDRFFWSGSELSCDGEFVKAKCFLPSFFVADNGQEDICSESVQGEICSRNELQEKLNKIAGVPYAANWTGPEFSEFESQFEVTQEKIRQGEIKKVVPVAFESSVQKWTWENFIHSLKSSLKNSFNSSIYGFFKDESGILGCTPEHLFVRKGPVVKTMAIAGTRPRDDQSRLSLLDDEKELSEHRLVIEDIVAKAQHLGSVHLGETKLLHLPTLDHLKTEIEIHLSTEASWSELLRLLHPTAALGGFPGNQSLALLREWDSLQRPFPLRCPDWN